MSPRSKEPQPRLVTKATPSPEKAAAQAARWAHDTSGPNPAVAADAMGATVIAYLITGPALFGGIGWALDLWLGTSWLVAVGAVFGMAMSLYTIWLRYGTSQAPTPDGSTASRSGAQPHNEEIS